VFGIMERKWKDRKLQKSINKFRPSPSFSINFRYFLCFFVHKTKETLNEFVITSMTHVRGHLNVNVHSLIVTYYYFWFKNIFRDWPIFKLFFCWETQFSNLRIKQRVLLISGSGALVKDTKRSNFVLKLSKFWLWKS
jgi:hypothetical protein